MFILDLSLRQAVPIVFFIFFSQLKADESLKKLTPFLSQHCFSCHGKDTQKGDIRLDSLGRDLTNHENLEIWQGVLDQLNLGEMPPKKQPQPTISETKPIIDTLSKTLKVAYEKARSTDGKTVLRRLNRQELRNTFRDLLYLNGPEYNPGAAGSRLVDNNGNGSVERTGNDPLRFFPEDEEEDGFFNIGDKLVMSDFYLKLVLGAVEEVLTQATRLESKPKIETRTFSGHLITDNGGHLIESVSRKLNPNYDMMATGYERFGRLAPTETRGGVGMAARYRITIEASAHNKSHPWGDLFKLHDNNPFQICLNIADTKNGGISGPTSTPLALWSVPEDGKKHTFTHEVWVDKTWTPWIGWENGPWDRSFRADLLVEKTLPNEFRPRPDKKTNKDAHDQWPSKMAEKLFKNGYKGPHIRIHSLKLEPLINTWPPKSHSSLYGNATGEEDEIRQLLKNFAERAFRQPVSQDMVEPYVQMVLKQKVQPLITLPGGIMDLKYEVYKGLWEKLPDFDTLQPVARGNLPKGLMDIKVSKMKEQFGMVFTGKLNAPKAGEYVFEIASDDGARIIVGDKIAIEHDGLHGAQLKKGKINLTEGEHKIRVEYFGYGQPNSFRAGWSGTDITHTKLSVDGLYNHSKNQKKEKEVPLLIRAMQDAYSAILCSPQFLYLRENPGALDDYGIANRMSYFLWSSMPDKTLFALASAGKLKDSAIRKKQVERMLKDDKAQAFIRHFPSAWLRLDKLGDMPPSGGDYQFYKNLRVEPILARQVTMYFEEILKNNGKIEEFIDSDYTFMNQTLAKWIYRREGIRGERLRKVSLNDPKRGGIFTQPGLMTATANGVETSPVIRGVWVLENILGTPPSPPPPDVEPLPTNTREATDVRELLDLHRKNEACYSCHAKIDPMGFAFENFDVVGRWRDKYKRARDPIDTSATLSNGKEIADIIEFKKMLLDRKELVTRCLTTKMLTYATGRKLEATDRGEVEKILEELNQYDNRLRDLVNLVVQSQIFLNK